MASERSGDKRDDAEKSLRDDAFDAGGRGAGPDQGKVSHARTCSFEAWPEGITWAPRADNK